MPSLKRYTTDRLILREWQDSDLEPFAKMNADPEIMEFMAKTLTREESDKAVQNFKERHQEQGFCFWALELKSTGEFVGTTGLGRPQFNAEFTPCVEVGWRIDKKYWNQGLATEAALKSVDVGFIEHGLKEIVAITYEKNFRSMRIMEKIGMSRDLSGDFEHPLLEKSHPLLRHVLYRLKA